MSSRLKPLAIIIEDDFDLADFYVQALTEAGYETEVVYDGIIGLAQLAVATPDLVVLDLKLPQITGDHILRKIRSDVRLATMKVFVTSADPILAETLRNEADLVLIKPVSFNQLRDLAFRLMPREFV